MIDEPTFVHGDSGLNALLEILAEVKTTNHLGDTSKKVYYDLSALHHCECVVRVCIRRERELRENMFFLVPSACFVRMYVRVFQEMTTLTRT